MSVCSIDGCTKPVYARGWCQMHYRRWRNYGDVNYVQHVNRRGMSTLERLLDRVTIAESGCWLWTGPTTHDGYGYMRVGTNRGVHRIAYEQMIGAIPDGLHLDHLCRVPRCVNPDHLEAVTPDENRRRGLHGVLRTHCRHGHELTPENVYDYGYGRVCRKCARANQIRYRERKATP